MASWAHAQDYEDAKVEARRAKQKENEEKEAYFNVLKEFTDMKTKTVAFTEEEAVTSAKTDSV